MAAIVNEYKKLLFFKFCKSKNINFRVFEVFGVGTHNIIFAESIQTVTSQSSFKLIRMVDVTEFVINFSASIESSLKDFIIATNDLLFDYKFENFSYKELMLK